MKAKDFGKYVIELEDALTRFAEKDAPELAGIRFVEILKENFESESFFGDKWLEVDRRKATVTRKWKRKDGTVMSKQAPNKLKGVLRENKILHGTTGNLKRSITHVVTGPNRVVVSSDTPYGKYHNEGVPGRLPKRQFMGKSKALEDAIYKDLERRAMAIFN
jgi:phage gpG-like protein